MKGKIVGCFLKEFLIGREITEDGGGHSIDVEGGNLESIRPVVEWDMWPGQKSETGLYKMAMLSLNGAILDTSVWTW